MAIILNSSAYNGCWAPNWNSILNNIKSNKFKQYSSHYFYSYSAIVSSKIKSGRIIPIFGSKRVFVICLRNDIINSLGFVTDGTTICGFTELSDRHNFIILWLISSIFLSAIELFANKSDVLKLIKWDD